MKVIDSCKKCKGNTTVYYSKWMALNFSITFKTFCEFAGFGPKRAQAVFGEIMKEMRKYDLRDNYNYNLAELQEWFDSMSVNFNTGCGDGLIEIQDQERRAEKRKQERVQVGVREAYEAKKQLEIMQAIMKGKG